MVAGAALSILGGVVAQLLSNAQESRTWKRDLHAERVSHVRQIIAGCLDFADLVSLPYQLEADTMWDEKEWRWWAQTISDLAHRFQIFPAGGSSIVMYVDDDKLMDLLREMAKLTVTIWIWSGFPARGLQIPGAVVDRRDDLRNLASDARARIDYLVKRAGRV